MCALSRNLGVVGSPVSGGANSTETENMGRFDSRNTNKMRQRKAQAKKKARDARHAEETRAERKGGKKG